MCMCTTRMPGQKVSDPVELSYRQLQATIWVLEIKSRSTTIATSAINL